MTSPERRGLPRFWSSASLPVAGYKCAELFPRAGLRRPGVMPEWK